jgi:nitrite reductase/ring-hydroxylating ferredoxin subunit
MTSVKVAKVPEIPPGTMMGVEVKGAYFVVANVQGEFHAMDGTCSHLGGQLWKGTLEGFVVKCPRHGSRFDLRTGEVVSQVRIPLIGKARPLRTYLVSVDGEDVSIDI